MSGISRGSIFFTPVVMALSVMNTAENIAKVCGRVAFAGVIAVHKYNKSQEEKKEKKLSDDMQKLDDEVNACMAVQREELYQSVEKMLKGISETHKIAADDIDASDGEAFRKLLRDTGKNTLDSIDRIHGQFQKKYTEAVNRSNSQISTALTRLKENILSEISEIEADIADRDRRALERASGLLEDAKSLAGAFSSEAGDKYIAEAESDIEKGNFQSAVSLASMAVTQIYMDMYKSDAEEKEREFYRSSLVYLSAQIKELLDSFRSVEFKTEADSDRIMTGDLTQFMKCQYADFCRISEETDKYIENMSDRASSSELRRKTEELSELVSVIYEESADAFYFMNYSLNRVEVEKSIYGILKEKGFTLTDTKYTDGDPSKAGERKYSCALTGEELTISLIPYSDENDELKTELVLLSNKSSEESREQYRKDITERLKKSSAGIEGINLKCSEESRNRDADEIGKQSVIENPQPVRKVQR